MDLLVIFSQVSLAFVRIIGLGVGIDFLIIRKKKRFSAQVAGWSIWTFSSIMQILSQFTNVVYLIELFDFLFGMSTLVGSFLISIGIIVYFHPIEVKYIFSLTLIFIILPLIVYFLFGLESAVNFSIFGSFMIIAFLYLMGIFESQSFKQEVGQSVKWFYVLIFLGVVQMIVYTVFTLAGINLSVTSSQIEDNLALTVVNSFSIALMVITVVLFVHLENSRSVLYNFQLKDRYSHDLANIIQIIASAIHLIEQENIPLSERDDSIELLDQKLQEVLELLQEIRTLE